ncbi:MAG: Arc family DNA-binding protein [Chloroflexi bacterium]|nr:Arc family DNA-binding protein [Chloroflexota bacterium]
MPVNLSIKNVPDQVADELRKRARMNHRSLQGELMAILEGAVGQPMLSVREAELRLRRLGYSTGEQATAWIREDRNAR